MGKDRAINTEDVRRLKPRAERRCAPRRTRLCVSASWNGAPTSKPAAAAVAKTIAEIPKASGSSRHEKMTVAPLSRNNRQKASPPAQPSQPRTRLEAAASLMDE